MLTLAAVFVRAGAGVCVRVCVESLVHRNLHWLKCVSKSVRGCAGLEIQLCLTESLNSHLMPGRTLLSPCACVFVGA